MVHHMKLRHEPFTAIQSGQKDVELRLHDEKRQAILPGDTIEFTDSRTGQTLQALVADKRVFRDFGELYAHYDKLRIGYQPHEDPDSRDMEAYYSPADIARWGAAAIELKLL